MAKQKSQKKRWDLLEKIAIAVEPVSGQRLAALLVHQNDVIAVGTNKYKTHPLQARYSKNEHAIFLHAEIDCINNALRLYDRDILKSSTLFVLRLRKPDDSPFIRGNAKPCEGCQRAIKDFGITSCYYTTEYGTERLV